MASSCGLRERKTVSVKQRKGKARSGRSRFWSMVDLNRRGRTRGRRDGTRISMRARDTVSNSFNAFSICRVYAHPLGVFKLRWPSIRLAVLDMARNSATTSRISGVDCLTKLAPPQLDYDASLRCLLTSMAYLGSFGGTRVHQDCLPGDRRRQNCSLLSDLESFIRLLCIAVVRLC